MNTVLIKHVGSRFEEEILVPWLQSFSNLSGVVDIDSGITAKLDTLRHEYRRSGLGGVTDALLFRGFYALRLAEEEQAKIDRLFRDTATRFEGGDQPQPDRHETSDPNDTATQRFLAAHDPDLMIARCKVLLDSDVFEIPTQGTFVLHPGICPEYRNAHGCFWALANNELEKVGFTLLRIDEGVDTGPIYLQQGTDFDPLDDEHVYIQYKVIADNLNTIRDTLQDIAAGEAASVDISDRPSAVWGQPKLSAWLQWKRRERRFT